MRRLVYGFDRFPIVVKAAAWIREVQRGDRRHAFA